jgi:LAGLIDADG endonuclease
MLTFQIGLHIDDLFILVYIKNKLNCGHISISGKKCNYFINDKDSLLQILLPIFNFTKLNSSKYHQFILFEKVVNFIRDKKHLPLLWLKQALQLLPSLSSVAASGHREAQKRGRPESKEGKLEMIKFYHEMKKPYLAPLNNNTHLTIHWLGGFTDGDASFSIFKYKPRLKFENHIKELELFNRIKDFLNISNNLSITKPRLDRSNSNATVSLDITDIHILKKSIVPLYSKDGILKTKKFKDFNDWSFASALLCSSGPPY